MPQSSDPAVEAAVLPLDWNFYATDSSVIFRLEPSEFNPYWVEAHAHFGRFNSLPLSVFITSHQRGLEEGTGFLERVLKELLQRRLPAFLGQALEPAGIALQPSVYYFGIHLKLEPLPLGDPACKHLPRRARQQVESVLNQIPAPEAADADIDTDVDTTLAAAPDAAPLRVEAEPPQGPAPSEQYPAAPVAESGPPTPAAISQPAPAQLPAQLPSKPRAGTAKRSPKPSSTLPQPSPAPQPSPGYLIQTPLPLPCQPPAGPALREPEPAYALAIEDDDILF